jgi:hypothetical protein
MIFLQSKQNGKLVKVADIQTLADPNKAKVSGRIQAGEEEQPPEEMDKTQLLFPSGEALPQCWIDVNYRKA